MATKKLARDLGLIRCRKGQRNGSLKTNKKGQVFEYIFVIDFESTCWDKGQPQKSQEIIEFPAVLLQMSSGRILAEFQQYVLPFENPKLSDFCIELTGITQEQVDCGVPLQTCLALFTRWVRDLSKEYKFIFNAETTDESSTNRAAFATWSDWDLGVCLQYECRRKQFRKPDFFNRWMDIRALYKKFYSRRPQGLHGALQDLGLNFDGRQHSGICDARNTASLIKRMAHDGCILEITKSIAQDYKTRNNMQNKRPNQDIALSLKKHKSTLQPCVPEACIETDGNSNVIGVSLRKMKADELAEANTFVKPLREVNGQHTSSTGYDHSDTSTKVFLRQTSQKIIQKMKSSSSHNLAGSCKDHKLGTGRYTSQSQSPETLSTYNSNSDSINIPIATSEKSSTVPLITTYSSNVLSRTTTSSHDKLPNTTFSVYIPPSKAFSSALPSTTSSNILPIKSCISVLPSTSISRSAISSKSSSSALPTITSSSSGLQGFSRTISPSEVVAQECFQDRISPQPSTSNAPQSCFGATVKQKQCKSDNSHMKKIAAPASPSGRNGPFKALHHSEVTSVILAQDNDHTPNSRFQRAACSRPDFLPSFSVHDAPNPQFKSPRLHSKAASMNTSASVSASHAVNETLPSSKEVSIPVTTEMGKMVSKQIRTALQHSRVASVPMSSRISSILRQRQHKTPLLHSKSFCAFTSPNVRSSTHQFKTPLPHFRSLSRLSTSALSIIPPSEASQFKKTPPFCGCGRRSKFHITDKPGPNQGRGFFSCPINYNSPKNCSFFRWEDQGSESSNKSFAQISPASTDGHQVSMTSVQTSSSKHVTPRRQAFK